MSDSRGVRAVPPDDARWLARRLAPILAVSAALKLFLAWRFPGFLTGDDLEVVQTAAKYALGVDYHPWVLRCLFHPIVFVAPFLKAAAAAGARDPAVLGIAAAIPSILASTAAIALVAALAMRWGWPRDTAATAAFLYAFAWLPLAYGSTAYPRPVSTLLLLGAFYLASSPRTSPAPPLFAGLLAGAAFAVRWSEGVVLIPLVAFAFWKYRTVRRPAAILIGFLAGALLTAGLVDWLTWGAPFASLRAFVRIMWVEIPAARPAQDATSPLWYARTIFRWAGPILVLLLLPSWRVRRAREPVILFLAVVALVSAMTHAAQEWRYLQAAIPFLTLGAAAGWERLRETRWRRLAALALVLTVPYGVERAVTLSRDKSASAIAAARFIQTMRPIPKVIALEQMWAYGERLWLPGPARIVDIPAQRPLSPDAIRTAAAGANVIGVWSKDLDRSSLRALAGLGFHPLVSFRIGAAAESALFTRDAFVARPPGAAPSGASETTPAAEVPPSRSGRPLPR